jgi:hypothetical protein
VISFALACTGEEAGNAFYRAGAFQKELKNDYEMQAAFTEAAKAFRKGTSHDRSVEILNDLVIPHMLETGKHGQAAKVRHTFSTHCKASNTRGAHMRLRFGRACGSDACQCELHACVRSV